MNGAAPSNSLTPSVEQRLSVTDNDVTVVIGLEVHVQLDTDSKLFCSCSTRYGAEPNTQTCPVCVGMPGTLPVVNGRAIELAVKTGVALNCEIARFTKWDRKNYFYPDLPKGYQISQYDQPICGPGHLDIADPKKRFEPRRVRIERAHLEEDAGKSIHDETQRGGKSRIDLNRTGTPLLEIVTKPDLRSAEEAKAFLTELKLILTYIDVSDCNMQQGSLRCDGNINLHIRVGEQTVATPIVEIKNLNSFRNAERALEYEASRQLAAWRETGLSIADAPKQTRGWDDATQSTTVQREKEDAADYRYFPDPDLVPVTLSETQIESIAQTVTRLPGQVRGQLVDDYQLSEYDADVIASQGVVLVDYFFEVADGCGSGKSAANWIGQEVLRHLKELEISIEAYPVRAESLTELIRRIASGDVSQSRGKDVLDTMVSQKVSVDDAIQVLGIVKVDRREVDDLCEQLIAENPSVAAEIKEGNMKAVGALIGKAKKINPNVDPGLVRSKLLAIIAGE